MVFHSLVFLPFVAAFFICYFISRRFSQHLSVIVIFSAIFYGWWDWRFLGLIALSSGVDYYAAIRIEESAVSSARKLWLWLALGTNIAILFLFKYFDFFSVEFSSLLNLMGVSVKPVILDLVLPVGISFYTFQSMGYAIDVYRNEIPAEKNPISYLAFIMFFPQLVAGPIEKAADLLPQLKEPAKVGREDVLTGLFLILAGYFKKIVIAERLQPFVNSYYDHPHQHESGWTFFLGTYFLIIYIYCDFSGYCNIASGLARLMGIRLSDNFRAPFFATSPSEFFQRWHISFTNWVKNYLLFPLALRTGSIVFSLFVALIVMGLWHGPSANYALYGLAIFVMTMFFASLDRLQRRLHKRFTPAIHAFRKIFMRTVFIFIAASLIRIREFDDFWFIVKKVVSPGTIDAFFADITRNTFSHALGISDYLLSVGLMAGLLVFQSFQGQRSIEEYFFSRTKMFKIFFVSSLLVGIIFFRPFEIDGNYFYFQY